MSVDGPFSHSGRDTGAPVQTGVFARDGEYWTIEYRGQAVSLRGVRGLAYIQELLQHPRHEFHCLDLTVGLNLPRQSAAGTMGGDNEPLDPANVEHLTQAGLRIGMPSDAGEMLDAEAKSAYKRRLTELREELESARQAGAANRADQIESEIDSLLRELKRAVGLRGRDRGAASASERARLNVTRAIKSAVGKISAHHVPLGHLLARTIRTGTFCHYAPDPALPVVWNFTAASMHRAGSAAERGAAPLGEPAFPFGFADRTAFVARDRERTQLRRCLQQALDGRGKVVTIEGEAGVGKTRLAVESAQEAWHKGVRILAGRCHDTDDSLPYGPFVEVLEAALPRAANSEVLREALGKEAPELARLLPQLRRLLPELPQPPELPTEQSRRLLLASVVEFLARSSRERPMLLLLDDLHWADAASLGLLDFLAQRVAKLPILIIGTYRSSDPDRTQHLAKTIETMTRSHLMEHIQLQGLSEESVGEMLRIRTGREIPPSLVRLVYSQTEGNPFFVEELFEHLLEQGELFDSDGEFRHDLDASEINVPSSVRRVIESRFQRLSERTRKALAAASVIGYHFSFPVLEALIATGTDTLLDAIDEAEWAGLVVSSEGEIDARLRFSHALVQHTLASGLSHPRRQHLHLKIANIMEQVYADSLAEHSAEIAHHLLHAGRAAEPVRTIRHLATAAQSAISAGAYEDAERRFASALYLTKRICAGPERDRQEFDLLLALSTALIAARGYAAPELEAPFSRMLELCDKFGEAFMQFLVQVQTWTFFAVRGDQRGRANSLSERLLKTAQVLSDPMISMWADLARGVTLFHLGEFAGARTYLERALAAYNPGMISPGNYENPGVGCNAYLSLTLWSLGYLDQAVATSERAIKLARELRDQVGLAHALHFAAAVRLGRCEYDGALRLSDETIAFAAERGLPLWTGQGMIWRGAAMIGRGEVERGTLEVMEGIRIYSATGAQLGITYWISFLAEAHLKAGRVRLARELLEAASSVLGEGGEGIFEIEIYRLRGEATLAGNSPDRSTAAAWFRKALELARSRDAKTFELRVAMSFARLLISQGKVDEARALVSGVCVWFTEGLETGDLKDARSFLDQLEHRSGGTKLTSRRGHQWINQVRGRK